MSVDEMLEGIKDSWNDLFNKTMKENLEKKIFSKIDNTLYQPIGKPIFNVFRRMDIKEIKVVILGQDPYYEKGKATGYAFAVPPEYKLGKRESLSVIIKEIENEKKFGLVNSLDSLDLERWQTLEHWIESGVFLLNTALTVKIGEQDSHLELWKEIEFTNKVVEYISKYIPENSEKYPCIWMLWGEKAKKFKGKISNGIPVNNENIEKRLKEIREKRHIKDKVNYILEAPHPSPKNGYKFCKLDHNSFHNNFLNANKILKELYGKGKVIEW